MRHSQNGDGSLHLVWFRQQVTIYIRVLGVAFCGTTYNLVFVVQINLEVKVLPGANPRCIVVREIQALQATCAIFDK